jgi:hypothetical protein
MERGATPAKTISTSYDYTMIAMIILYSYARSVAVVVEEDGVFRDGAGGGYRIVYLTTRGLLFYAKKIPEANKVHGLS